MLRVRVRGDGLRSTTRIIQIVIDGSRSTANAAHTLWASVVLRLNLLLIRLLLAFILAPFGLWDTLFADFGCLRLLSAVAGGTCPSKSGRDIEATAFLVVLIIGARHRNLLLSRDVRGAATTAQLVDAVLILLVRVLLVLLILVGVTVHLILVRIGFLILLFFLIVLMVFVINGAEGTTISGRNAAMACARTLSGASISTPATTK